MNAPAPRNTPNINPVAAAAATVAAAGASPAVADGASEPKPEWPKLVHAYRRQSHVRINPRTGFEEELPVEVVFMGKKTLFKSNAQGHIVAEVHDEATYRRLTEEIPEAYIPYTDGESNVPTERVVAREHKNEQKPKGDFVLSSVDGDGKPVYKVLDTMKDEELRAFAQEVGIEADALPEVLTGKTLQRTLYNLMAGSAA